MMIHNCSDERLKNSQERGFALVAAIALLSLILMVSLAFLTLSTTTTRLANYGHHEGLARANARMALVIALGDLQRAMGPDQRVSANSAILEPSDGSAPLANRQWLGVWNTTYTSSGRDWPIVGKAPDLTKGSEPYPYRGIYSDLRQTEASLQSGNWKTALRRKWLVSGLGAQDPTVTLDPATGNAVQLVGRGTLGEELSAGAFAQRQVIVPKVEVEGEGINRGSYAFWITDNNQKAAVTVDPDPSKNVKSLGSAAVVNHPGAVQLEDGTSPYDTFISAGKSELGRVLTHETAALTGRSASEVLSYRNAFRQNFHDLSVYAPGLFTNTVHGGFKKDLTPLLFGQQASRTVSFTSPNAETAANAFSSSYPIIPGQRRAVMGPSFDALRHWGLKKYTSGLSSGTVDAETSFATTSAVRSRPTASWPHRENDGMTFESSRWAAEAPKVHPVMTEARWHWYLSHTDISGGKSMRTHIIPRVCMWNPYNVDLRMPKMVVLMDNPFKKRWWSSLNFNWSMQARISAAEKARLQADTRFSDPDHPVQKWHDDIVYLQPTEVGGKAGLFPDNRFLGFELEATTIPAGQCLVFSPKVTSGISAGGIRISAYDPTDISNNVLAATEPQGENHFYHEYELADAYLKTDLRNPRTVKDDLYELMGADAFTELRLGEINRYSPHCFVRTGFPFFLKAANGSTATSTEAMRTTAAAQFPTIQTLNCSSGGANTYDFWFQARWWGHSTSGSGSTFGNVSDFVDTPRKDAPALHQFGVKLLSLDESSTEANSPPLRVGRWTPDHVAFNPTTIANWNIRPHITTRSPSAICGRGWVLTSKGGWLQSFAPLSPQNLQDMPILNASGQYRKCPLGLSLQFADVESAVMFDLPDVDFGALSLASLRHANLSPYSWHPSYIVGSSFADLHAPYEHSAHPVLDVPYPGTDPKIKSSFTYYNGNSRKHTWGTPSWGPDHQGLLQLGAEKTSKTVDSTNIDSEDELLTYDIAFEVNQNLWDHYFMSGVPMNSNGGAFDWKPSLGDDLWNDRYGHNTRTRLTESDMETALNTSGLAGLGYGFWNNGYILKNQSAFNVNSTSESAWIAFLSGLRDYQRSTKLSDIGGDNLTVFSRTKVPNSGDLSANNVSTDQSAWDGGRVLTDGEIRKLANFIVREVKDRGPFLSMADFVNRRLAPKADPASRFGTLEAALEKSGINAYIEDGLFDRSTVNASDNNHLTFRADYDKQPLSKTWGLPSHIMQSDILEPLGGAMTVRGDTFTIRCYGESVANGRVMATAYLEATVTRSAEYVNSADISTTTLSGTANRATDPALLVNQATGALTEGSLSQVNRVYGRKFEVVAIKWLSPNEI